MRFNLDIAGWDEQEQQADESHFCTDNEADYRQLLATLNAVLEAFVKQRFPQIRALTPVDEGGAATTYKEAKR